MLVTLFIGLWAVFLPLGYRMPLSFLVLLLVEEVMLWTFFHGLHYVRRDRTLDVVHGVLLAAEIGFHSTMFYFLGGVSWLGSIAFIYGIIYAAVFLNHWQAFLFTALVCVASVSVMALDATGAVPHQVYLPQGPDRYRDAAYVIPTAVSFCGVIITVALWMVFLGSELRRERDGAVHAYTELMLAQEKLRQLNEELELQVAERTQVLVYRAEHDQLTQLLNRGTIARRCQDAIGLARRSAQSLAVIVADSDNFKACNDTGGHSYGDDILRAVAECLSSSARDTDLIGRFGGDEFLVVLPDTGTEGAELYCQRVVETLAERRRFAPDPTLPYPTLSLGIAVYPDNASDVDDLVRVADAAMYRAKAAGGNTWRAGVPGAEPPVMPAEDVA